MAARLCRLWQRPYGVYLRGELVQSEREFASALGRSRFTLAAGEALKASAAAYCQDVETVTPMNSVRSEHVVSPRVPRNSGRWNLLYVGRIEERKGVRDLLAAAAYLEEWGLPFVLTMIGHCPDVPGFLSPSSSSVARHVRLVEPVSEFEKLIPYYAAADAFVFPSHDEGFPRVLYEAMALGVPIITTFVGSISGVMEDRKNCLRIEVRNPRDIAEKVRQLIANPTLQSQLAWAGHDCITRLMRTWQRPHALQVAERLSELQRNWS